jgi:hypothetical protein
MTLCVTCFCFDCLYASELKNSAKNDFVNSACSDTRDQFYFFAAKRALFIIV